MGISHSEAYAAAGVDIEAGYQGVKMMNRYVQRTLTADVISDLGGFGGLFSLDLHGLEKPVLVSGTDGVGTKQRIAQLMDRHNTVGIDCVAMCVNDVVCQGAKPLIFLDYIATGKLDPELMAEIVKGVADACIESGCALLGGETAEMAGFYASGDYDVAGFAVGIVDRKNLINGEKITAGDVILGLPSTGIHSNGYSLVRRIISDNHLNLKETYEGFDKPLGEVVLTPTKLYPKLVLPVLKGADVKGLVHITGGGFYDNIPRVLPEGTRAVLDADKWPLLPIFSFIKAQGGVEPREMYRTFNCGLGMLLILSRGEAEKAKKILKNIGEAVYEVGTISEGNRDVIVTGGLFHE